jgi:hypothetical protein
LHPDTHLPIKTGPHAGANLDPGIQHTKRMEAARAVAAANRPGYKLAAPVENPLKIAVDAANDALLASQPAFRARTAELHASETKFTEAAAAWTASRGAYYNPSLPEHIARSRAQAALHRDHAARLNAERHERVQRGEPAEVPKAVPNYQSEFDRKRGTAKRVVRPLIH